MSGLLIGRIVDWSVLGTIESVAVTSESFTLSGNITVAGNEIEKAKAVRDQIVGLTDIGEEFVPLRLEADPTLDGMVKVRAASVSLNKGALELGRFPWSITADRVPGGALPNVESPLIGGYRTNGSVTSATVVPWHAVPAATLDYYDGLSAFNPGAYTLPSATGDIAYYLLDDGLRRQTARYALPPANWYDGAACIEQAYPDGNYYNAIGRLMYSGLSSTGWRLTNGIVRISPSATAGALDLQMWEAGAWGDIHTFSLGANDGVVTYSANRINTVSILRNAPEECRVRLTVGLESGGSDYAHRTVLDLRLRRGARVVECRWSTFGTAMLGDVGTEPAEAGTAFASALGGVTNTADAQGNTALIANPSPGTFAAGSSRFTTTTPSLAWSFGLGIVQNGSFATLPWRANDLQYEYLAPFGERVTVVGW